MTGFRVPAATYRLQFHHGKTRGPKGRQVVAFARLQENSWAVVAVAQFFTRILSAEALAFDPEVWQESFLSLPPDAPTAWVNILTGETINPGPRRNQNRWTWPISFRICRWLSCSAAPIES
jgi:maltooligosyltrehalose synthase